MWISPFIITPLDIIQHHFNTQVAPTSFLPIHPPSPSSTHHPSIFPSPSSLSSIGNVEPIYRHFLLLGNLPLPPLPFRVSPFFLCYVLRGSYVGIQSAGFRDFLLKPELLLAIT